MQIALHRSCEEYVVTGGEKHRQLARDIGAVWVGKDAVAMPVKVDSAIIFAPVGALVPLALKAVRKGGIVICAGIHMSDIPSFPYSDLWGERTIKSVANLEFVFFCQ